MDGPKYKIGDLVRVREGWYNLPPSLRWRRDVLNATKNVAGGPSKAESAELHSLDWAIESYKGAVRSSVGRVFTVVSIIYSEGNRETLYELNVNKASVFAPGRVLEKVN